MERRVRRKVGQVRHAAVWPANSTRVWRCDSPRPPCLDDVLPSSPSNPPAHIRTLACCRREGWRPTAVGTAVAVAPPFQPSSRAAIASLSWSNPRRW